jgi:heterodisulfide reductase subunit C
MNFLPNLLFALLLIFSLYFFTNNIYKLIRNIKLGKNINRTDNKKKRFFNMLSIAFGQSKMVVKPVAGVLHVIVYLGFIIINIELLEIVLDGILGTHRLFAQYLGRGYNYLIGSFEVLALLVLISVILFWIRRNIIKLERFWKPEMKNWPKKDADLILYFEVVIMLLFLSMNSVDSILQYNNYPGYIKAGYFPISQFFKPLFDSFDIYSLFILERLFWWLHIISILFFLNYLYYSKHLHILLAFPNTYYAKLGPKGMFEIDDNITKEVKLMMGYDNSNIQNNKIHSKFGASDIFDLNWVQLMNSYSCTECGRCTSVCPANLTGKKLSPRKIMMDTRDRLEEVGSNIFKNKGKFVPDNKELLNDYITKEELWACTSCNACVESCPIEIDPLSIIMDMRKYLVMEKSEAPLDLNNMMSNIENNGAPWPFNNQDRMLWTKENN